MKRGAEKTKSIVIVATLDTRGDEVKFLKEIIEGWGYSVITIDTGVMGQPSLQSNFIRQIVAIKGGKSLQQLVDEANAGADRKAATDVMTAGAKRIVEDLYSSGAMDAILCLGGTTASASSVSIMKSLPIGFPKLLITTFMMLAPIGEEDITVMQSPVDLVGLNKIVVKTLFNAAGAVAGMIAHELPEVAERRLAGITALGVTTPAVQKIISRMTTRGYDSLVFHATAAKLDRMAKDGTIDAILDITPFEIIPKVCYSDELVARFYGSINTERSRLECILTRDMPLVIAPGGLDMHIFPGLTSIDGVPDEFKGRAWSMHGPNVVLVRTSKEELQKVGRAIAEKAKSAMGPVTIVVPLRGFSEASKKGAPLYDPEADRAFIETLKGSADKKIKIKEVDCDINDEQFADEVAKAFDEIAVSGR